MFNPDSSEALVDPARYPQGHAGCSFDVVAQRLPTSNVSTVILIMIYPVTGGRTARLRTSCGSIGLLDAGVGMGCGMRHSSLE
jgi:hypothetical protein